MDAEERRNRAHHFLARRCADVSLATRCCLFPVPLMLTVCTLVTLFMPHAAVARGFRILFWILLMVNGEYHKTLMVADLSHCALLGSFGVKYYEAVKKHDISISLNPVSESV